MATTTEKPQNDTPTPPTEPSDKELRTDLKLARADLREMRQKMNALESNYKREKSKREKLEAERNNPKDEAVELKNDSRSTETVPTKAAPDSKIASTTPATDKSHVEHEMAWVPPYCGEHGCKNDLFKDEVVCASCNGPIGSEKYAKHQLSACPLCGKNAGYRPRPDYQLKHNSCKGSECSVN